MLYIATNKKQKQGNLILKASILYYNNLLYFYKIDLSFSIKLQEINLNDAKNIRPNAKRDDRIPRPRRAQI